MLSDLRHAARQLVKSPGFTAVVIATFALGIGATTAVFTAVNALLLRPLPAKAPEQLVAVVMPVPFIRVGGHFPATWRLYAEFRQRARSFSEFFAVDDIRTRSLVVGASPADFVQVDLVTGNFFTVLGVPPAAGRTLLATDDRRNDPQAVAVISYAFWQRRFGSDARVVGQTVRLENAPFTIVGVAAAGFHGVAVGSNVDVWCPLTALRLLDPERDAPEEDEWMGLAMGRLKPGVGLEQARAELNTIFQQDLTRQAQGRNLNNPETRRQFVGRTLELQRAGSGLGGELRAQFQPPLKVLVGAVIMLLLITCANVAGLLLARGAGRQREFALRAALGAGRGRLIRQLLGESVLLAALGGACGMLVAQWGTAFLGRYLPEGTLLDLSPDNRVLAFALAIMTACGIFCGLIPALRFSRIDLNAAMKTSGWSIAGGAGQGWNHLLVVLQVALSCVLLSVAGMFVRSLHNLRTFDAGFARDHLLTFTVDPGKDYAGPRGIPLYRRVLERLHALPGVSGATLSAQMPLVSGGAGTHFKVPGYVPGPDEELIAHFLEIGPQFFSTLGFTLLRGRAFNDADTGAKAIPVAIMGETMARHFFGTDNPIGRHFVWGQQSVEIVGVSRDMSSYEWVREKPGYTFYRPYVALDTEMHHVRFQLRTFGDPRATVPAIYRLVQELEHRARVFDVHTMEEAADAQLLTERAIAHFSTFFSVLAVLLASLGLYGLLSYGVVRRTREIGVRVALGAQLHDIVSLVLRQGLGLALLGCVVGLAGTQVVSRFIVSFLFEVTPGNPFALATAAGLLLAIALLACWLPARRAAKVDPIVALRSE